MRYARPAVAVVLSVSMLGAGAAQAATKPKPKPKPPCNVITDGTGDAKALTTAGNPPVPVISAGPSSDTLDVTSADIAGSKKFVTAVIRVKKLSLTDHTAGPLGLTWQMFFTADGTDFTVAAHTDPTGATNFDAAYASTTGGSLYGGGVTGAFVLAKNEVHITVPTELVAPQATIKVGTKLTNIHIATGPEFAINDKTGKVVSGAVFEDEYAFADTAATTKTYVVGNSSCVVPGT